MKILHISPEQPSEFSGGGKVVLQTIKSLYEKNSVDYIGPKIENIDILKYYNNALFLGKNKNKVLRMKNLFLGITSSFYTDFKKQKINYKEYDLIILEFTKFDFVIDIIKKNKIEIDIMVRVHNIEFDYCCNNYKNKKNLKNLLLYKIAFKKEKKILMNSKKIVTLTNEDKLRISKIYNINQEKIKTVPVCVESYKFNKKKIKDNNILLTGSLWYGPNSRGIEWFLENVSKKLNENICITIAGSKPTKKIINLVKNKKNIKLIKNPDNMDIFFEKNVIYIAPIFDGAGMKVKIGEALANKMIVIGSRHSFIGYNEANDFDEFIFDDSNQLIKILNKLIRMNESERSYLIEKNYRIYKKEFSIDRSKRTFTNLVESITNE